VHLLSMIADPSCHPESAIANVDNHSLVTLSIAILLSIYMNSDV
jgi:hypothetical protein